MNIDLDPYKAQDALRALDQATTHALVEARAAEQVARYHYEHQEDPDLSDLQDWREAQGYVTGIAAARQLLIAAVERARGSCRWCGGPDDHGQDCRPAPYGTLPRRIR